MSAPQLRSFQEEGVRRILSDPMHRHFLSFDTGLGKSATAIRAAKELGSERTLIVTPAVVRNQWREEFDQWWPEHPNVGVISLGRARTSGVTKAKRAERDDAYASSVQVVSYALLDQVDLEGWQNIIFDETHRLKSPLSQNSRIARQLVEKNPEAAIVGLSATLMPDDIKDIWNPLDIYWPSRFGRWNGSRQPSWEFRERYSKKTPNEYSESGFEYKGINPGRAEELRRRLEFVAYRVTREEVAHLLPPFLVTAARIEGGRLPYIKEWAEDASERAPHICILTHLRETAREIAESLAGLNPVLLTGENSVDDRNVTLKALSLQPRGVLVATMHSLGIGINLGFCSEVLFAELGISPEHMQQALGRFDGFRSRRPVTAILLCQIGSEDERQARIVRNKVDSIDKVLKSGGSSDQLKSALDEFQITDDEAIQMLNQAIGVQ